MRREATQRNATRHNKTQPGHASLMGIFERTFISLTEFFGREGKTLLSEY